MLRLLASVLMLGCLASTTNGAVSVDLKRLLQSSWQRRRGLPDTVMSPKYKRDAGRLPMTELDDVLSLDHDTRLQVVKTTTTAQGTRLIKMQEIFKDLTVSDGIMTLETDMAGAHVLGASGAVYRDIDLDPDRSRDLDPQQALTACLRNNSDEDLREIIKHVKVEEQILFDDERNPYLVYLVQYLVLLQGEERRPTCTVDARDGHVTMSWDALASCTDCTATGTGGNLKIGKIRYGDLQRCLNLRQENGVCYLENKYVRVINNNFTEVEEGEETEIEVASYNCREMGDEVNGAYSPLLDALFYGTVVGRMYEDWYNTSPLGETLTFRVHYGVNVSNAFWNGYECQYGDGNEGYFPFISLDIVSHEIAHGITEKNSGLFYFQQWGGINEAFSDMAGETAEAYLSQADWLMGVDISKQATPLRYFKNPEMDNNSISHVANYSEFMNPHFGSGVYNRAFYLLVHDYGLPIKDAFHVFLHANQMYWHHMSNYAHAACDVMKSAYDLGQDGSKFRKAFSQVGLDVCDPQDHVLGLKMGETHKDITVSKDVSPFFLLSVPGEFAETVTVNASSLHGHVKIIVSNKTWGAGKEEEEEEEEDQVHVYAEGLSSVQFELPSNTSMHVSVTLFTQSETPLTDVTVQADFDCMKVYVPTDEEMNTYYIYFLWLEYCDEAQKQNEDDNQDEDSNEMEEVIPDEDDKDEKDQRAINCDKNGCNNKRRGTSGA